MSLLFNADKSDSDEELKINNNYAVNYDTWRQKEELNKLKTKYGGDVKLSEINSESSSSSEDEEDANEPTQEFDKEFYKTLACLKKKDPCIYDEKITFFQNAEKSNENAKTKEELQSRKHIEKSKKLTIRDYERKIIMERNGKLSDSEDETPCQSEIENKPTYVKEQQELKESFKPALEDDEDTELFAVKSKSRDQSLKEDEIYKEWLKGNQLQLDPKSKEQLQPLRDFWTDPNLDSNEKFLRDYILNNKYSSKQTSNFNDDDEVLHDSDECLSEDERNIEEQEEFEHKYNFRFEEPDQEFIKRYPRTMENLMRKKDNRRSQKRAEIKKRKEDDKSRKKEELKKLKALKRKEIEEKIEKIKEITGNDDIGVNNMDLEADFDPTEHDLKMKEIFNDDYYAINDGDKKPEFQGLDEELQIDTNWDDYDPNETELVNDENGVHCEDPDFNMDADYQGGQTLKSEMIEATKKKKRRRSKFAELVAKEKPKFDPKSYPKYEEYFDQYYSLDYEDMIGDLPCRFKYRKVVPNDYGLSVEEILTADDKELNKWCSLKKALQHKSEKEEMKEVQSYRQKVKNDGLKKKILKSLYNSEIENHEEIHKNNELDQEIVNPQINLDNNNESSIENGNQCNKKSTKKKKHKKKQQTPSLNNDSCDSNAVEKRADAIESNVKPEIQEKNKKRKHESVVQDDSSKKVKLEITKLGNKSKKASSKKKKSSNRKSMSEQEKQLASFNEDRLKMFGINAKKLKNKMKYGKQPQTINSKSTKCK